MLRARNGVSAWVLFPVFPDKFPVPRLFTLKTEKDWTEGDFVFTPSQRLPDLALLGML